MSRNELKARWVDGETTYGMWSVTGSTFVAELMALEGPDYVCLDIQHGLIGYDAFLACLYGLARTGSTPVVRVPANDGGWIGKVLDAGAEVVIVPMIETAEQAEQAVRSCRYFPQGNRSVGPVRAAQTLGGDPDVANREVACLLMIETALGVANAAEICSVPGVDGIYVGPGDLALTYGLPPTLTPQPGPHADGIWAVRDECLRNGIVAGVQCRNAAGARRMQAEGFRMLTVATDAHLIRSAVRSELAEAGARPRLATEAAASPYS
jgi:4-hydroxy-2-oxoheptanedioate aldolase